MNYHDNIDAAENNYRQAVADVRAARKAHAELKADKRKADIKVTAAIIFTLAVALGLFFARLVLLIFPAIIICGGLIAWTIRLHQDAPTAADVRIASGNITQAEESLDTATATRDRAYLQ